VWYNNLSIRNYWNMIILYILNMLYLLWRLYVIDAKYFVMLQNFKSLRFSINTVCLWLITTPFPNQIQKNQKCANYHELQVCTSAVFKNYFIAILKKQPLQHDIIIIIKYNILGRIVLKMIATKITSLIWSFP